MMYSTPVYQKRIMVNLRNMYSFSYIVHHTFRSSSLHIVGISFLNISGEMEGFKTVGLCLEKTPQTDKWNRKPIGL